MKKRWTKAFWFSKHDREMFFCLFSLFLSIDGKRLLEFVVWSVNISSNFPIGQLSRACTQFRTIYTNNRIPLSCGKQISDRPCILDQFFFSFVSVFFCSIIFFSVRQSVVIVDVICLKFVCTLQLDYRTRCKRNQF